MWAMSGALRPWALILARSPGARTYAGGGGVSYTQGQSPEPRTREYFYYVDHQGQVGGGGVFTVRQPGLPGRAGNTRTRGYGPKGLGPQRTTSRAWLRPAGFASPGPASPAAAPDLEALAVASTIHTRKQLREPMRKKWHISLETKREEGRGAERACQLRESVLEEVRRGARDRCGEVGRAPKFIFHAPPCTWCTQTSKESGHQPGLRPTRPFSPWDSSLELLLKGHGLLLCSFSWTTPE